MGRLVRVILAGALGIVGFLISLPSLSIGGHEFDGAVLVVPGQEGVDMFLQVDYEPKKLDSLEEATTGEISISLLDGKSRDDEVTHWYVILIGDAWLTNPRYIDADGTAHDAPFSSELAPFQLGTSADDTAPLEYQFFQLSLEDGGRLVGTPKNSPLSRQGDHYSLTMPKVVSLDPEEGSERDGGVILGEAPTLALLVANTTPPVGDGWTGWHAPHTTTFMLNSGLSETETISVTRSAPELDRDKWGQLAIWTMDYPFEASALFGDSDETTASTTRASWSFLFYGAALPLLLEAALSRGRKAGVEPAVAVPPPPAPEPPAADPSTVRATRKKPIHRRKRK